MEITTCNEMCTQSAFLHRHAVSEVTNFVLSLYSCSWNKVKFYAKNKNNKQNKNHKKELGLFPDELLTKNKMRIKMKEKDHANKWLSWQWDFSFQSFFFLVYKIIEQVQWLLPIQYNAHQRKKT